MRNEIVQVDIEKVRRETATGGNTCQRIASILTQLNDSKLENNEVTEKLNEKASVTDLGLKADSNAGNLTPQQVEAWNTKLKTLSDAPSDNKQYARKNGAWEEVVATGGGGGNVTLPDNIATIDKNGEVGNAYAKATETITNTDANYKYVVITNDAGGTKKMQVTGLGKNISNSDLQVPVGTIRTLNVEGAVFQIQGLKNKKLDASFNKKIKVNDAGQMAYSDEADITLNIPEKFTGQPSVGSTIITVNHTYPNQIPERPAFADELKNIMAEYKNIVFTPINQGDLVIKTKENKGLGTNKTYTDGSFFLSGSDPEFNPYTATEEVVNITTLSALLPNDKNWILKISGSITDERDGGNVFVGVCRGEDSPVTHGISTGQYSSINIIGNERLRFGDNSRNNFLCLIVKTGGVITTTAYQGGKNIFLSLNAFTELGNYIPKISLRKASNISARMSYKILD